MKNDLLLVVLLVGWIAGSTYYYVCHIREHCCGECDPLSNVSVFDLTKAPTAGLQVTGEGVLVASETGIRFVRNGDQPTVTAEVDTAFRQLAQHLADHPDHALHITGWYDDSERNNTLYKNMGLARAEEVRHHLVAAGVADEQIGTAGRSSIDLTFAGDTLLNGLTFRVSDERPVEKEAISADTLAALENRLRASTQTLYFEQGATSVTMTPKLERYLRDVQNYLLIYPDRAIVLTGHTDNVGSAEKNVGYGQERADFTKEILSNLGINPDQIKTRSEGETNPITDNDTREGRSQNRRVEITIE